MQIFHNAPRSVAALAYSLNLPDIRRCECGCGKAIPDTMTLKAKYATKLCRGRHAAKRRLTPADASAILIV